MSDLNSLLTKDFEEQERKNREKYGPRDNDHIASIYKKSLHDGNVWCWRNVEKYMVRFTSDSSKANNPIDALKAIDYLCRLYDANKTAGVFDKKEEVVDDQYPDVKTNDWGGAHSSKDELG